MTDRPIIFSAPMVKALVGGRKTQTRRLLKPQPEQNEAGLWIFPPGWKAFKKWGFACQSDEDGLKSHFADDKPRRALPYAPGDRLWVREAWRCNGWATDLATIFYRASEGDGYTAMCEQYPVAGKQALRVTGSWRPSIHMPRWASRLTLIVTDVRVQRLQDISEADAIAEGCLMDPEPTDDGSWFPAEIAHERGGDIGWDSAKDWFADIWEDIHGPTAWDANPWVCAISFTVARGNIDEVAA